MNDDKKLTFTIKPLKNLAVRSSVRTGEGTGNSDCQCGTQLSGCSTNTCLHKVRA